MAPRSRAYFCSKRGVEIVWARWTGVPRSLSWSLSYGDFRRTGCSNLSWEFGSVSRLVWWDNVRWNRTGTKLLIPVLLMKSFLFTQANFLYCFASASCTGCQKEKAWGYHGGDWGPCLYIFAMADAFGAFDFTMMWAWGCSPLGRIVLDEVICM